MSEFTREQAAKAVADVEKVTAVVLPDLPRDLIVLDSADAPTKTEITRRMAEISIGDTNSIVSFGASAQTDLQAISQSMLAGVGAPHRSPNSPPVSKRSKARSTRSPMIFCAMNMCC